MEEAGGRARCQRWLGLPLVAHGSNEGERSLFQFLSRRGSIIQHFEKHGSVHIFLASGFVAHIGSYTSRQLLIHDVNF
jgi:hypothetical protein